MDIMEKFGITDDDLATIPVNNSYLKWQLNQFDEGIPKVELTAAATPGNGIKKAENILDEEDFRLTWDAMKAGRLSMFIPASGAASRMFKKLETFLNSDGEISMDELLAGVAAADEVYLYVFEFIRNIRNFAFYDDLEEILEKKDLSVEKLLKAGNVKTLVDYVIGNAGLGLSSLPKGVIKFHKYKDENRTPFLEHLIEASLYMKDHYGQVTLHFTVSPEHRIMFTNLLEQCKQHPLLQDVRFDVSFSMQKKGTDTIALDENKKALRDGEGNIMFRPGGHGALLENLNDLGGDLVIIKNVDNVSPDNMRDLNLKYKKYLVSYLLKIEKEIHRFQEILVSGEADNNTLDKIEKYCREELNLKQELPGKDEEPRIRNARLFKLLHRPIRVCGMVKNEGDPGGGPFWVKSDDGESLQIVEASQIDKNDPQQKEIMENSTHFNPVDIVSSLRNFKGKNYNLLEFRDDNTAFISKKSKNGQDLFALELPGLWNGSMARWTTIFIEVPKATFNPVKEINDLLKPGHICE